MEYVLLAVLAIGAVAALLVWYRYRKLDNHNLDLLEKNRDLVQQNRELQQQNVPLQRQIPIRKTAEEQQDEHLERQLRAVKREGVKFWTSSVMGRGEYEVFKAAIFATGQRLPNGALPYYVFPQLSLGEIIHTSADLQWQAKEAHRPINSKRCDLLIADRNGKPVALLEYQGSGHDIDGTAQRRDEIKRIALERAGARYVEITDFAEIQQSIRQLLITLSRPSAA